MEKATVQSVRDRHEWSGYVYGASVFLVIWFYSNDLYGALKFSAFFVLFNCLPGMVLLDLLFPQ